MSERQGLIFIDRSIFSHPMFDDSAPFSQREAWLWMLCRAFWKPGKRRVGNVMVSLERGQFSESIRYLADTWHWDKMRVSRYIKLLESEGMIETAKETESKTGQTVITICNYNKFQNAETYRETAIDTDIETQTRHERIQQRDSNETATRQQRDKQENQIKPSIERETPTTRARETDEAPPFDPPDTLDALGRPTPAARHSEPLVLPACLDRRTLTPERVIETVARVKFIGSKHAAGFVNDWQQGGATLGQIHDLAIDAANTAGADRDWMIAEIEKLKGPKIANDDPKVRARRAAIAADILSD
jgi:DNA-binding transcriptional regulator YhcF (GntR family)